MLARADGSCDLVAFERVQALHVRVPYRVRKAYLQRIYIPQKDLNLDAEYGIGPFDFVGNM